MNSQIRHLFLGLAALFAALVGMSSYWLWRAPELEARQGNPTLVVRQVKIERGLILASDGKTELAANRSEEVRGDTWFLRRYPTEKLVAQTVGYSTLERSRAGLEQALNDFLTGSNANLKTVIDRTLGTLQGLERRGNDVVTTIDLDVQRTAMELLQGKCGAAVALEPKTGRVLAVASQPSFDPNLVAESFEQAARAPDAPCDPAAPLLNRGTQGLFIPGSTFKVVTATAALDTGTFTPESEFVDPGYCEVYGRQVRNYSDQPGGTTVFGRVTFAQALENSINSVFCMIGKELGPITVLDYARRFGFYAKPPLETPDDERTASGLYDGGELFFPEDPNAVDPGRLAFGQERLLATPMQMAMVAAAVANGGVVMRPQVVERIVAPDGTVISRFQREEHTRAMKPETAATMTGLMRRVVESGTATVAQIPGVPVAAKTGTAETGRQGRNDTWLIAFAPANDPQVAVAVALSNQSGTGGSTAGPIAKAVLEAALKAKPAE